MSMFILFFYSHFFFFFFFFQAEDGIRDLTVTGVQTCALPISLTGDHPRRVAALDARGNRAADLAERQRLRDADQHRAPDPAAVRNRRLLGLPAGARSGKSRAGRHDWPPARERRPRPDAPLRRT